MLLIFQGLIDHRVPWQWTTLALLQPILHLWIARRTPWPLFKTYCYFSIAADCLWLWKAHNPYSSAWQVLIIPHAILRAGVALEVVFIATRCIANTSKLQAVWEACKLAALAAMISAFIESILAHPTRNDLSSLGFAVLMIPRLWALTLVTTIGILWLIRSFKIARQTRNHCLLVFFYLLNMTVVHVGATVTLGAWLQLTAYEMGMQAALLTAWVISSYDPRHEKSPTTPHAVHPTAS